MAGFAAGSAQVFPGDDVLFVGDKRPDLNLRFIASINLHASELG